MFTAFVAIALLTVSDPSVGPTAAESLTAPSSALYRNLAPFDLQEVTILDSEALELRVQLGSYANPLNLDNGFSHPIVEIYVGGAESGSSELLPGSGLSLPEGEAWNYAIQLTGDHVTGYRADASGVTEFVPELQLIDEYLYIMTAEPPIQNPRLAALTGLYSPFHETGWRPLSQTLSPWAFSSAEQVFPVIDVLALTDEAQLTALTGGVLPVTEVNTIENPNTVWFALMAAGIGLAGVGLIMRGFARPAAADQQVEPAAVEPAVDPPAGTVAAEAAAATAAPADTRYEPFELPAEDGLSEDESEDAESSPLLVGVFRGADHEPAASVPVSEPPAEPEPAESDEAPEADEYALPEHGSIDFGEFEARPVAAENAEHDGTETDKDSLQDKKDPAD